MIRELENQPYWDREVVEVVGFLFCVLNKLRYFINLVVIQDANFRQEAFSNIVTTVIAQISVQQ